MRFLKTLGLMTLTSLLFSCGSGGSSSNISSGFLSAAPVDNANCSIYKITSEGAKGDKLTSKISKKGVVAFSNIGYSGKALIECSAGDYTDEATNDEKQSPMLRAALNFTEGEKFAITPLTEIAIQIDTDLNKVIDTHNNTVANAFGLSGKSITLILPTDIDKIDVDDDDAGDYAMILAMLSKFESQGASESNSLSKVIDLLKIDLTDKTLDRMTVEKLIMALNALESKFKNVNADRIKTNMIGNPLLTNLLTKNLISGSAATFTFNNIGGDAGNCGVEPNLPSGLTIALTEGSCEISGTPVALQDTITYTVKATNLKGDSTATVSIRVDLDTPKNLVATIGDGTIALAWSAVSGATGYKIYYAQNEISASNLGSALLMQSSNASGIVNNLTNSTKYYFVVTAVKEGVESSLSAAISATPVLSKPSITNLSAKHLILHDNITAFVFNNTGGAISSCSATSLPNGLSIMLTNGSCQISGTPTALQNATTYTIQATNASGDSSATISISVGLGMPRNLTATKGDAAVDLTWSAVSGATGYKIYYTQNEISASNLGSALSVQVSSVSRTVNNLTNDTKYYFVVTAVEGGTESPLSAMVSATPVLNKPSLANLSAKQLTLNASIEVFAFINTGGIASNCSSEPSLPSGLTMTLVGGSCQISGTPATLQAVTVYTIKATNTAGDSTATISISVSLGAPKNLVATEGSTIVDLAWDAVSGATGYKIYYAQNEISASNLSNALSVQVSSVSETVNNLTNDTKYYFVVTAVKGDAESALSAMVSATPILRKPSLVNLSVKHLTLNASIEVFAFINTGGLASSCNSEPSLPSGLTITLVGGSCQISGTPTALQDATTYTIKAINSVGDNTATVSISVVLGVPKNLTATKGDTTVDLAWDAVSGATGYKIYYAQNEISPSNLSNALSVQVSSVNGTVNNLTNNTKYYFVVTTVEGNAESFLSVMVSATPVLSKPSLANLPVKYLILNTSIEAFTFINTGGLASSCSSETGLPSGLTMALMNGSCQISGTPTTLQNAVTYTIKATNSVGDNTATVSIRVILGIPKNLIATKKDAAVELVWDAVNGATKYQVYHAKQSFSGLSDLSNYASLDGGSLLRNVKDHNKTITGLINDTRYYFVVTAIKGADESSPSAMVSATPVLSKPSLVNLSAKHLTFNASIKVFTFMNTGGLASSCNSEPSLPSGLTIALVGGSCQISGTPTALQDATTYTIKATNSAGDSTATISISVDSITPENLTSARSNGAVFLAWNAISGATKYQVYYAMQSFNGISNLSNYASLNGGSLLQNITSNSKFITNLTNGTKYYFVVTTTKDAVESDKSNEVTATPLIGVLNDTGITQGGNYESGNNDTCTGEKIAAQDCSHGRDGKAIAGTLAKVGGGMAGFDFTKLGSTGNVLSIQNATWEAGDTGDTGTESAGTKWSCVKDNHTGLVWEVKNYSNKFTEYAWGGKTALGRNHASNQGAYNDDWTSLVDSKNAGNGYCGFTNWKVPTIIELRSIVHQGMVSPKIDNHYFPNTETRLSVWSSSPSASNLFLAWQLRFDAGYNHGYSRGSKGYVRLVRSGQ
ncbi:fibronectin type III domain-containing protein [Bathymodiolus thermophilus thioautotrophic gill symbiont]|uniref:Fibronectin type-III domain-containing protein n=1 Tax=Bathymodiolus thermophilus thioautotrophic gill symbiont TaxID=2360 RepID=A0A8H8XB84_9GAMM|nr:fibronectin type III domain-containing protein [Bathymodiolus thermophilus thioautotrophic gill symbiont]CAB5495951.1 hypothetical protein THERMOS_413 [Bathymodiolus thermophilus thioautotrophic gill symbiont]